MAALCIGFDPAIVFLDVTTWGFSAVEVMRALARAGFRGAIQLVSGNHGLLEDMHQYGVEKGLRMLAPLRKPFRMSDVVHSVRQSGADRGLLH